MLTHDYIALQYTKLRREELMRERKNENLLKIVINEAKAQLQERLERKHQHHDH